MRLIDADTLGIGRRSRDLLPADYCKGWNGVVGLLECAPTVDAKLVIHAHWISFTDCSNAGVYCSHCHKKVYKEDYALANKKNKLRSNYCPNCGAKCDDAEENY